MKKILLVSPHFDDAVLSAGQFMADRPDADVATVFAGLPLTPDNVHTPYDTKCGFKDARDAIGVRIRENDEALALLEARAINLDFPDSQYKNKVNSDDIVETLQHLVDKYHYEFIMGPIGIGHPDHLIVTNAILRLKFDGPIYLWEDLPLRVMEPELVWDRVETLNLKGKLWQTGTTGDKIAKKIRSMTCYKSQVNTGILDPYIMYVPERFWKYREEH